MRLLILIGILGTTTLAAQPRVPPPLTDELLQTFIPQAVRQGGGDPDKTTASLDRLIHAAVGDVETHSLPINPFDIYAVVIGPYASARQSIGEAVRKMRATADIHLPDHVDVVLAPNRATQPDIERIVVLRDGQPIEASQSTIAVETFQTGLGAAIQRHQGIAQFPASAFAPGATVSVTLIPVNGGNVTLKLNEKDLRRLR